MLVKQYVDGECVGFEEIENVQELDSESNEEQGGVAQEPGDSAGASDTSVQDSQSSAGLWKSS